MKQGIFIFLFIAIFVNAYPGFEPEIVSIGSGEVKLRFSLSGINEEKGHENRLNDNGTPENRGYESRLNDNGVNGKGVNEYRVNEKGIAWDKQPGPSTESYPGKLNFNGKYPEDIVKIEGLVPETTYFLNYYNTGSEGTGYSKELVFTTAPVDIGDEYQGGILAYVLLPGDPGYSPRKAQGIIAAPYDQGTAEWGCYRNLLDATSTDLGTGAANTAVIADSCGEGKYAAKICDEVELNGYDDWFLPSRDELNKLYLNREAIGGFSNNNYWTSSEFSPNHSWYQSFPGGDQYEFGKSSELHIRAVRYF